MSTASELEREIQVLLGITGMEQQGSKAHGGNWGQVSPLVTTDQYKLQNIFPSCLSSQSNVTTLSKEEESPNATTVSPRELHKE